MVREWKEGEIDQQARGFFVGPLKHEVADTVCIVSLPFTMQPVNSQKKRKGKGRPGWGRERRETGHLAVVFPLSLLHVNSIVF